MMDELTIEQDPNRPDSEESAAELCAQDARTIGSKRKQLIVGDRTCDSKTFSGMKGACIRSHIRSDTSGRG